MAGLRDADAVGILRRACPLTDGITPLVRLSEKCNMSGMSDTHVVTNQVPPLENYNPATSAVLVEALIREGGEWGLDEVNEVGAIAGGREAQRWGELADRNRPDPAHPRPVRPPRRRGRVRPGLPRVDAHGHRSRHPRRAVGRRPPGRARGAGRENVGLECRARPHVPDLDDVCRRPRAALQPRTRGRLRAAADQPRIRPRTQAGHHQARHHRRHVDDREAGRIGRARRHHAGHPERPQR